MAGRKIKIETVLNDGSKISIIINGNDIGKAKKFLNLLEALDMEEELVSYEKEYNEDSTLYNRIYNLIRLEFGRSSFDLNDLYKAFILKYNEDIKKSTLATYLSRLVETGILERIGRRGKYRYRYIEILSSRSGIY